MHAFKQVTSTRPAHARNTPFTTHPQIAGTIAVYMFSVGVTALFWGPFCDRFGRRSTLLLSCTGFIGFSIGCVFAPSITGECSPPHVM